MQNFTIKFVNMFLKNGTQALASIDIEVYEDHHVVTCIGNSVSSAFIADNFDNGC